MVNLKNTNTKRRSKGKDMNEVVTRQILKDEFSNFRMEMQAEFKEMRNEMREMRIEIRDDLRAEMRAEFKEARIESQAEFKAVRSEISVVRDEFKIKTDEIISDFQRHTGALLEEFDSRLRVIAEMVASIAEDGVKIKEWISNHEQAVHPDIKFRLNALEAGA